MGAYTFGPENPPVMEGGNRSPTPGGGDGDGCHCAAVHLAPRFLRPLVHKLLAPAAKPVITEKHLHPSVDRVVSSLLNLQETVSQATAKNGMRVHITFSKPERIGDDFKAELRIRCDNEEVFEGRLATFGVWKRGKVSFAHAIIGGIELLYLHFLEMAPGNEGQVDLRFGILELSGKASGLPSVKGMVSNEITVAMMRQQNDPGGSCLAAGPFDPMAVYGAFPSGGFGYFFGTSGELLEESLDGRTIL